MFTFLKRSFQRFLSIFSGGYSIKYVEVEPKSISDRTLYIVGENGFYVYALMVCPCGCKSNIHLNLIPSSKPSWSVENHSGKPTLRPSVWRQVGCKSHFFVRNGTIVWAKGS